MNATTKTLALLGTVAGLALAVPAATADDVADSYEAPVAMDINFAFWVDMDLHEQDVFIERDPGSGEVFRVTKGDHDMSATIYNTTHPIEHEPFEPEKVGPYPKGKELGFTLGRWYEASGTGTYTCRDGSGTLDIQFTNLVPNGTYTMWHFFMANPVTTPYIGTYDLPVGARDGSESVFYTDENGNARFRRDFRPCLQMSGEHLASGLAVAWHSDGKTYGVLPGEFASDSHLHMMAGLPKRAGLE